MDAKADDRWGEKVFEATDFNVCWDGTCPGKELNTGVFVYYFDALLISGEKYGQNGTISLVK